MLELIQEGESILIFPEGRRTPTGEMQSFREGIGLVATALRVPVIPVRLDGLFDIAGGHGGLPKRGKVNSELRSAVAVRGRALSRCCT